MISPLATPKDIHKWVIFQCHDYRRLIRNHKLVGGWPSLMKNISQFGWLFQIYGKIKVMFQSPPTRFHCPILNQLWWKGPSPKSLHTEDFQQFLRAAKLCQVGPRVFHCFTTHWNPRVKQAIDNSARKLKLLKLGSWGRVRSLGCLYPLVIQHSYWKSPCFMRKSTINGDFP